MVDGRQIRTIARAVAAYALAAALSGCAARKAVSPVPPSLPPYSPTTSVIGVASWYGPGFDGHRTADGEIYNQEDLTAATMLYPLGSRVIVTNLTNHRLVEVRINDRGPFVKHRAIDLSHKAATLLGITRPGTAPVRIDLISSPEPFVLGRQSYFVQVGSFALPADAERLSHRLGRYYSDVRIDPIVAGGRPYYRVEMGAFATLSQARTRAAESSRLGLPIIILSE